MWGESTIKHIISIYSYNNSGIGIIIPNSQVVKLRSRKVKQLLVWAYVVTSDLVDEIRAH